METLQSVLLVVQVLVAIGLIGIILIQHGKGADAGAAFGSGASSTVFGAQGSGNFLSRATSVLALVFLLNSLALAYIATQRVNENESLMRTLPEGSAAQPADEDAAGPLQGGAAGETDQSDIPAVPE